MELGYLGLSPGKSLNFFEPPFDFLYCGDNNLVHIYPSEIRPVQWECSVIESSDSPHENHPGAGDCPCTTLMWKGA